MPFETLDMLDLAQPTIAMLQTSSLTSAVQQALERMITLGEIGPGDKLSDWVSRGGRCVRPFGCWRKPGS